MTTNADITIFNARYQPRTRLMAYAPTTIRHVSLLLSDSVDTNDGIWTANASCRIRIPYSGADIQDGRTYLPPDAYAVSDWLDIWTIRNGDFVALGLYDGVDVLFSKAEIDEWSRVSGVRVLTITESADNTIRGSRAVKHWRIGGA
jgi:hypothetical protein